MNREILFRGKTKKGNWIEGTVLRTKEDTYICYLDQFDDDLFISPKNIIHSVIPESVGQYIGLEDKNGRRIFEGDILKRTCYDPKTGGQNEYNSVVYYSEKCTQVGWRVKNSTKTGGWSGVLGRNKIFNNHAEVIGNVTDNPELISQ